MASTLDPSSVKVYTVNGAPSGSSSALPDWLTRKRSIKEKGKRGAVKERVEGSVELIQDFEFPEASNKIKTTRDGHHAIATGTYKPQMRVWELDQLTLKFERHSDSENVDFVMLSDDWTKSVHLQNDRTVELHTQGGLHYRTRIPKFGRALAYHFPSCDTLFAGAGNEIFRLNLDQGRFMTPLALTGDNNDVLGVNCIDINPAHQLFSFGVEGNGTAELWDPRSRTRVGMLRLPRDRLLPANTRSSLLPGIEDGDRRPGLSVTAICSRSDGLSYAVGTSSGHTLLYDIRSARPFAIKDQGYGLPVQNVSWIEGGSRMAGEGLVLSADKKVIKIWDRHSPSTNFTSITAASDINDVHHVPGSGLLLLANEGIKMTTYYIPQLGPAPRWCSFLENLTEEMEDQTTRTAYQDFKFIERGELSSLGLDHLVGTPALKPYMHGYFVSLQLYDTARLIANPYAYEEHRERVVQQKMEKMAETRIRSKKDTNVKINKALAEKVRKEEERAKKKLSRKQSKQAHLEEEDETMDVDEEAEKEVEKETEEAPNLLNDSRFKALFENPEFQVDENSREYALLNPSSAAHRQAAGVTQRGRTKTAVEEEEEDSDKSSTDGFGSSGSEKGESDSEDSDVAGELWQDDIRARMAARNSGAHARHQRSKPVQRNPNVRLVPLNASDSRGTQGSDRNATFGQRRSTSSSFGGPRSKGKGVAARPSGDGGLEISFMPQTTASADDYDAEASGRAKKGPERRKGVEAFGAGMEKGGSAECGRELTENERQGRTHRRKGMRSGSKNTFRKM